MRAEQREQLEGVLRNAESNAEIFTTVDYLLRGQRLGDAVDLLRTLKLGVEGAGCSSQQDIQSFLSGALLAAEDALKQLEASGE